MDRAAMLTLDKANAKPLHIQIEESILQKLESGDWAPGRLIPSENELSHIYGVSRTTVRNVITKLVQEGLLFRIPGKGTYVAEPKIVAHSLTYAGIREQLEQMGYEVSTRLILHGSGNCGPEDHGALPRVWTTPTSMWCAVCAC